MNPDPHFAPQARPTRTRLILANTGFATAALVASSLIALLITPVLIRGLGSELFGVWALFGMVIALSQMLDFGMGRALSRQTAQGRALGRWSQVAAHANSVAWPLIALGVALMIVVWTQAAWLASLLGVPASLLAVSTTALRVLSLSFVPMLATLLLAATIDGAQKLAYTSAAMTLNRLVFGLGVVLAVALGWGLIGVAGAQLAAVVLQALILLLVARKVSAGVRMTPRLIDRGIFREDWQFGRYVFAANVVALLYTATNKLILAHGPGLTAVAYYELAALVSGQLFLLALALGQALYPAFSATLAVQGMAEVRRIYLGSLRLVGLTLIPLAALIIALARPFIAVWSGASPPAAVGAMQWLTLAWTTVAVAVSASVALQSMARPGLALVPSLYNTIINLALAFLLVPRWGFGGLIAANVVAVSSSALLTPWIFARIAGLQWRQIVAALAPRVMAWATALALGVAWVAGRVAQPDLGTLVVLGAGYAALYVGGLFALGLLRPEESERLRHWRRRRPTLPSLAP